MNHTLRVPFKSRFDVLSSNTPSFAEVNYLDIDLHKLIDNHSAVIDIIKENEKKLTFGELITICDWLYGWYKKTDHYILSNRILYSFWYTLSAANHKRENEKC